MDYTRLITIEPGKRSGQPCIRGLRITVRDVLEYLAGGMSADEVLADFPDLTAEDIRACLAFAADRERRLWVRICPTDWSANWPANTPAQITFATLVWPRRQIQISGPTQQPTAS